MGYFATKLRIILEVANFFYMFSIECLYLGAKGRKRGGVVVKKCLRAVRWGKRILRIVRSVADG